jgi:hypothetical protein
MIRLRRAVLAAAFTALLTMTTAPPAAAASWTQTGDAKTTRLDISDDGWLGYAEIRASKHKDGGWQIRAKIHKATERSGCLRLKSDRGAMVPGSKKLGEQCKKGSKVITKVTGSSDSRLILEWPRSWKADKRVTIGL